MSSLNTHQQVLINDNGHLEGTSLIKIDGTTKVGFFGATPVVKPTALTAANASALNTGDATSDTVIGNIRTRLGEVETKLVALGLLTAAA